MPLGEGPHLNRVWWAQWGGARQPRWQRGALKGHPQGTLSFLCGRASGRGGRGHFGRLGSLEELVGIKISRFFYIMLLSGYLISKRTGHN